MDKIKVLYIQEKKIKRKGNNMTLGDVINTMVPDTYEMDYISAKENIREKIDTFQPQIIHISQSNTFDILNMVKEIRAIMPTVVIMVCLSDGVKNPQRLMDELKDAGVYKCYGLTLVIETLIHDMFVSLNME